MNDLAIRVDGLSKRYRLGSGEKRYKTLRDAIMTSFAAPFGRRASGSARQVTDDDPSILWALSDVSFDVLRGEVVGVIGRNGAGKSTLLKILSRITEPTRGRVAIYGRIGCLLEVGTGFHPELTGRENIFMNGAILGMSGREIRAKFDEIVGFAEVDKFVDTPVKRYSSGMYMRLAFAVAANMETEILIVDEVLAVGDQAFQQKCLKKMDSVGKAGRTILFVSHNMAQISKLCTKGVLLEKGRVAAFGETSDVVRTYLQDQSAHPRVIRYASGDDAGDPDSVIELLSVSQIDGDFPTFTVPWREPIRLELELRVRARLNNVVMAFGILSCQGTRLFAGHHNDDGRAMYSFDPGVYKIEISIVNDLRKGLYVMDIGASDGSGRGNFFLKSEAVLFDVLDVGSGEGSYQDYFNGLFNGYAEWSPPAPVEAVPSTPSA